MARTRTTKKLAQRIDLNYFKRPTPFKRAKLWLSILLPLLALVWIAERTLVHDHRVYSSGRLSESHAILEKECAACHIPQANSYSAKAADNACLACHDGPLHHAVATQTLECATCHTEHRGRVNISAASNQSCAQCHRDLRLNGGSSRFATSIESFEKGHPEFAILRTTGGVVPSDHGAIKLNHALHMKQIRRGPNGPLVQLDCSDCHRPVAVKSAWTYSDAAYVNAKPTYEAVAQTIPAKIETNSPPKPSTGRELMAPVKFATACASCHLLTFDKRFEDGAPHDTPEMIHIFLVRKFQDYIAAHPGELREMQDPSRNLSGRVQSPQMQTLTPSGWVTEHTAVAEELLWKKTCAQCHTVTGASLQEVKIGRWSPQTLTGTPATQATKQAATIMPDTLPQIAPSHTTARWLPHAQFDHDAHRGFTCISCHQQALKSTESTDVMIPGIAICQTCHAPGRGYAESRCFECHIYHDWSKRKEVIPHFTLPALQSFAH